jgi:hypothetical protein
MEIRESRGKRHKRRRRQRGDGRLREPAEIDERPTGVDSNHTLISYTHVRCFTHASSN